MATNDKGINYGNLSTFKTESDKVYIANDKAQNLSDAAKVQAQNNMMPTGISRVVEQIVNAVMSVFAAWLLTRPYLGHENLTGKFGAAGGTIGTGSGVLAGIAFMGFMYILRRKFYMKQVASDRSNADETYAEVFKTIFLMVTPIIFGNGKAEPMLVVTLTRIAISMLFLLHNCPLMTVFKILVIN